MTSDTDMGVVGVDMQYLYIGVRDVGGNEVCSTAWFATTSEVVSTVFSGFVDEISGWVPACAGWSYSRVYDSCCVRLVAVGVLNPEFYDLMPHPSCPLQIDLHVCHST